MEMTLDLIEVCIACTCKTKTDHLQNRVHMYCRQFITARIVQSVVFKRVSCQLSLRQSICQPQLLSFIQAYIRFHFFGHVARLGDSQDLLRALTCRSAGFPRTGGAA